MNRLRPVVMATVLGLAAGLASAAAGGPGAAAIFVAPDPVLVSARELIARGELARADRLLAEHPGRSDPAVAQACDDSREIIRRYRIEYRLSPEALLEKLRPSIPDVTLQDLETWRQAGDTQLRHHVFDGQLWYFGREPAHLLRFCEPARQRAKASATQPSPTPEEDRLLLEHLQRVLSEARREKTDLVTPIRHRVRYSLTVPGKHAALKPGSLVRCWLPLPQECRQQSEVRLIETSPASPKVTPSTAGGKAPGHSAHRAVYLEQKVTDPARPVVFREVFEYTCRSYVPRLEMDKARPLPASYTGGELDERLPHIAFTPEITAKARELVGDEQNPLARARKIYMWIVENVRWCPEEEYCIMPCIPAKVLRTRQGDCGAQSLLFITMCRIAGIPARWQSGWETKPIGWNMHDWAEFYVEPWGWVPADCSYGLQRSTDPAIREFYFGHLDSYRMIVNSDYGAPLEPAKQSLRSEPADFQRGEVEVDGKNLYFNEWDYKIEFEWK